MAIRPLLIALGLAGAAFAPMPAVAHDGGIGHAADRLSDPQAQLAAAAAAAAIAETILDIDIAPVARAVAAMGGGGAVGDLPRDARLRDLAGPDAERVPRQIARGVPRAMGSAAEMAGAIEDMLPELKATARRLRNSVPNY